MCTEGVALRFVGASFDRVLSELHALVTRGPVEAKALARTVRNKVIEKYDGYLSEDLLSAGYASSALDTAGAVLAVGEALERDSPCLDGAVYPALAPTAPGD